MAVSSISPPKDLKKTPMLQANAAEPPPRRGNAVQQTVSLTPVEKCGARVGRQAPTTSVSLVPLPAQCGKHLIYGCAERVQAGDDGFRF